MYMNRTHALGPFFLLIIFGVMQDIAFLQRSKGLIKSIQTTVHVQSTYWTK